MEATAQSDARRSVSMRNAGPFFIIGFALIPVLSHFLGGGLWYWASPLAFFVLLPLLDLIVGRDLSNVPKEYEAEYEASLRYRLPLLAFFPVQIAIMFFGYGLLTGGTLSGAETAGFTLALALSLAMGFSLGHELGHHPRPFDRFVGVMMLAPINVPDFYIYHNFGHHHSVATPEDAGSSKYGESLWAFWARSVPRKSINGWRIEARRLARNGLPARSWRNRMIWITAAPLAWLVGLTWWFGWGAIPVFIAIFLFSRSLLVFADYVEHYGLCRRKLPNGEYEKVRPAHSWNDSYLISNMIFCSVDRHSDHHANAGRPYQILRHFDDVPQLPVGYISVLLIAMIPPLWRRMVNPLCEALYERGEALPNALPGTLPERFSENLAS